jgi:phosphatidylserine/phosphatidylglycerophosphate/cardiolipin synthase-like enzyme
MSTRQNVCLLTLLLTLATPAGAADTLGPAPAQVSVCFVPEQECDTPIIHAIQAARTAIRVQAYGFTAQPILQALAAAKAQGIDVQVILDKSDDRPPTANPPRKITGARFTAAANIPTWIDDSVAIAHSKVIIIDGHLVIGGSYNYTASAERRNAENVTFIDAPVVAAFYLANWNTRQAASRPSRLQEALAAQPQRRSPTRLTSTDMDQ